MGLINETVSLLRPLLISTIGGLIIGTKLYNKVGFILQNFVWTVDILFQA